MFDMTVVILQLNSNVSTYEFNNLRECCKTYLPLKSLLVLYNECKLEIEEAQKY